MLESLAGIRPNRARWKARGALLAGGAALGLSFPPFPFPWLAWFALVPLVKAWDEAPSWSTAFSNAFVTFLATFTLAFSWPLLHAMPNVALASLNGLLLLPLWMAVPFGLAWPARRRLGRLAGLVALAASYLTMEAALSYGPLALPWALLAHTQAEALCFNQFADLTGSAGLTLWVLLLNIVGYSALISRGTLRRIRVAALTLLVGAPFVYSTLRVPTLPVAERSLRIGLIQPGASPLAWADLADTNRVTSLLAVSDSLRSVGDIPPELTVWPETAVPLTGDGTAAQATKRRLQAWVDDNGIALLTGAISVARQPSGRHVYRNSALLFEPSQPVQSYDKRRLVPFAERVPFIERWSWLERLAVPAGGVSGYEPGQDGSLLEAGPASVGVLICLESVFGTLGRNYAEEADLLVTITQDGWWGRSLGYRQHLAFTRLRAIETRRTVAQVSVSGTTALILPDGSLSLASGWMERIGHTVVAPLHTHQTFYVSHGDWLARLAYLAAFVLLMATILLNVRDKLRKPERRAYA